MSCLVLHGCLAYCGSRDAEDVKWVRDPNCAYDQDGPQNAMMESFFATLKTEYTAIRFATMREAQQAVFEYIEVWYNRQRRHSGLGFLSPAEYELAAD